MASRPKLTVNIRERDFGLSHLLREAAKIRKKPFVKVGVTQARGSKLRADEKKTTADIAQIHEYGAPEAGIPERSFIRSTVSKNQGKYDSHIAQLKDQIFDANSGMKTEKALGLIGQEVSADMKNTIRAGISPPLKDATIREKNSAQIAKAKATLSGLESKKSLSGASLGRLANAIDTVETGGKSTPLIDTAQMINAISYEVDMNGQGDSSYSGEGPASHG